MNLVILAAFRAVARRLARRGCLEGCTLRDFLNDVAVKIKVPANRRAVFFSENAKAAAEFLTQRK